MEISCRTLFILLFLTAAITGITVYFVSDTEHLKDLQAKIPDIPKFPNFADLLGREDPWDGVNETYSWPNNGTGLRLTILNALDDEWHPYFYKAVEQWDDGDPDGLTLQTEMRTSPDFNCTTERGYLKVCNGNYGATGWTGINKVVTGGSTGSIMSSAARMNDYYFPSSTSTDTTATQSNNQSDAKQYTMCHEIGHGFGLPHTDENFNNPDLGNCLDYTMHPEVNKQPGVENYKRLASLYGKVSRWSHDFNSEKDRSDTTSSALISYESEPASKSESSSTNTGDGTRKRMRRRATYIETNEKTQSLPFPDWILDTLSNIDKLILAKMNVLDSTGWTTDLTMYARPIVNRNRYTYSFDIGQGYKVHVHLLLAQ